MHKCLRLAVPWCDFCFQALKITRIIHIGTRTLVSHARHGGDESDASLHTHKALCVGGGVAFQKGSRFRVHPPLANSNERHCVSAPRWCSPFLPAGALTPFDAPYKTRGRDATVLLQINHGCIGAVAPVIVGAIVFATAICIPGVS